MLVVTRTYLGPQGLPLLHGEFIFQSQPYSCRNPRFHYILLFSRDSNLNLVLTSSTNMAESATTRTVADDTCQVINQPGKPLPIKDQLNHPPDGISDEDHARNQRALPMRKGKCAHCPRRGHRTHTCYCLRPDLRDNEWLEPPDVWVYKRGENSGKPPQPRKKRGRGKRPASSYPPPKPVDPSTHPPAEESTSKVSTSTDEDSIEIIV
ncbi:unnamed protein product [Penicillium pancosmium]